MPIFKPIQESEAKGKVKEIYDEIKTEFDLDKLPDLTEEELNLYYFMYNSWSSFSSRYFK